MLKKSVEGGESESGRENRPRPIDLSVIRLDQRLDRNRIVIRRPAGVSDWKVMFLFPFLFPTCQVRVVRFYHSCSPPPPPPAFASTPMFTSALPTLRQALRQLPHAVGTAGPQLQGSERTGHRWTSTWDLPSSVSTAGPQPGTVRANISTAGPQPGTLRAQ